MIRALVNYYDTLCRRGELSPPGWDDTFKVSLGIDLADNGDIKQIIDLRAEVVVKKSTKLIPRRMCVPNHAKRTNSTVPSFLCDNASYLMGFNSGEKWMVSDKDLSHFKGTRELHEELLKDVDHPAAKAVLAFLRNWHPEEADTCEPLLPYWEALAKGCNLVYCYNGEPLTELDVMREIWQRHYDKPDPSIPLIRDSITGETGPLAMVHPAIKGVRGGQSSGTALISYNAKVFESYGKVQGENASMTKRTAFAYTTALNTLLTDRNHSFVLGEDTTVLFWSENGGTDYTNLFAQAIGIIPADEDSVFPAFMKSLVNAEPFSWEGKEFDMDEKFFVLGITPNAARLAVRFFYEDSFGHLFQNVQKHFTDMEIAKPQYITYDAVPMWQMLNQTVSAVSNKKPSPVLGSFLLKAILENSPYPDQLMKNVIQRIQKDHNVNWESASLLKAYFSRYRLPFPKEVLTVSLNENCTDVAYTLGRLFAVYEKLQKDAIPNINTSIKDTYFTTASIAPATAMPAIIQKGNHYMKLLRREHPGFALKHEKRIQELSVIIGTKFPARLSTSEQGSFMLGYYHERQAMFTPAAIKAEESSI